MVAGKLAMYGRQVVVDRVLASHDESENAFRGTEAGICENKVLHAVQFCIARTNVHRHCSCLLSIFYATDAFVSLGDHSMGDYRRRSRDVCL